ncbi:MAG: amidase family protein [Xenococcaceae cyanobacterium MO_188.B19]|nr:amidase family protein [Xenococcaceae cyanobacterium MO_188.B19]
MASNAFRVLQGREIWQVHGKWIEEQKPDLANEIRERFMWCKNLTLDDQQQAKNQADRFIDFWHSKVLRSVNQVLLVPTTPGAAPLLNTPPSQQLEYRNFLLGLTALAGLTKAPQISLPYLTREKAPWGVSLLTHSSYDRALLACASKIDKILTSEG